MNSTFSRSTDNTKIEDAAFTLDTFVETVPLPVTEALAFCDRKKSLNIVTIEYSSDLQLTLSIFVVDHVSPSIGLDDSGFASLVVGRNLIIWKAKTSTGKVNLDNDL